jgi:hypothetical protein
MLDQFKALEELYGRDVLDRAVMALSREQRVEYEELLPVSWCSIEMVGRVIEEVAKQAGETPSIVQERIVRIGVERALKTIWRVFLRLTSDEAIVKRAPILYSQSYDSGAFKAKLVGPGHAQMWLDGWADPPELELEGLATGISTFLDCAGRRDVRITWRRGPEGGAVFDVHWRS